jgi:transcriptional regulator with XRE-family HTH domain
MSTLCEIFDAKIKEIRAKKSLSVQEIAERMTPVEESTLNLPRNFACNLRRIVQEEISEQEYNSAYKQKEILITEPHG